MISNRGVDSTSRQHNPSPGTLTASIDNGPPFPATLTVETEQIEIQSMLATKPDKNWEHVDHAGHFHAYDDHGKLPTLETRVEQVPCSGECGNWDCDGYTVTHYHCLICGEEVEPKRLPDSGPKFIPGPTRWTVEVEEWRTGAGAARSAPAATDGRVSVRLVHDGGEAFGVAARGAVRAEGGRNGVRVWTTYHGVTPLGYREKSRAKGVL